MKNANVCDARVVQININPSKTEISNVDKQTQYDLEQQEKIEKADWVGNENM